jgi:alginate O-acetyltransferase complex protein AlgI
VTIQSYSYLLALAIAWLLALPLRPGRARVVALLAASYAFYATWGLGFLAVLAGSTAVNYVWGRILRRRPTAAWLWAGICLNIALLAVFKYVPALGDGVLAGTKVGQVVTGIAMPVGLSFWTFQALSHLLDVYRGEQEQPTLLEFCLYMAFWPTVLSGPVMRVAELVPQLRAAQRSGWDDVAQGTSRLLLGLWMKVVPAQVLAFGLYPGQGVASGFDRTAGGWGAADVLALAVGFGFQLYFDFAGYSNMAIGAARLFGIRLVDNFDRPFFSKTPSEFWTRWHMSLSFWIRDYLFMPLASRRRSLLWRNASLVASMVVFGLWHGATWLLLAWGLYHGLLLVAHRQVQQLRRRWSLSLPAPLESAVSWGVTFTLVAVGWVLFRSHGVAQARDMLLALVSPSRFLHFALRPNVYLAIGLVVGLYFACSGLERIAARIRKSSAGDICLRLLSPAYYAALVLLFVIWSRQQTLFVYFQF